MISIARDGAWPDLEAWNRWLEPRIRAGLGSHSFLPSGLVLLETRGRSTGQTRSVPLLATRILDHAFVGTVRGARSQWVRNLAAHPHTRYWFAGRCHSAEARMIEPGIGLSGAADLPLPVRWLAQSLEPATQLDWRFAVLVPTASV